MFAEKMKILALGEIRGFFLGRDTPNPAAENRLKTTRTQYPDCAGVTPIEMCTRSHVHVTYAHVHYYFSLFIRYIGVIQLNYKKHALTPYPEAKTLGVIGVRLTFPGPAVLSFCILRGLHMNFEILQTIPKVARRNKWPWRRMRVGESVIVGGGAFIAARNSFYSLGRYRKWVVAIRQVDRETWLFQRVA